MTVTFIGPRSSTPKVSAPPRALPKVPKTSTEPTKALKIGRALPLVPSAPRPVDGVKPSRSLPRVPVPVQIKSPPNATKNTGPNPAIPIIPKGSRLLPKIPRLNFGSKRNNEQEKSSKTNVVQSDGQDRKSHLHDVYKSEADDCLRKGELVKALELYNSALKMIPDNKSTLVARSRCYQLLGKQRKSMQDVETALNLDPLFYEALYQRAELHYNQRDYEMALVFYSKGSKQRPDIKAFQEGLEKTQDAINRSTSARTKRMAKAGEMSFFLPKKKPDRKKNNLAPVLQPEKHHFKARNVATPGFRLRQQNPLVRIERGSRESLATDGRSDIDMPNDNDMTETKMKQILGRMYNDKKYLEQLVNQADKLNSDSVNLHSMAENGLDFLYDRVLYWVRQGRIIPPEAPILPPPKPTLSDLSRRQHDQNNNGNLSKMISPRSDENSTKFSKSEPRPRLLRKLDNDQEMQPTSWFRYLERKKVAELNSRKTQPTKFLPVLEGHKIDLQDSLGTAKLFPVKGTNTEKERKKDSKKKKRTNKHSKDRDNMSSSDADSGLNLSFATYRQPSDLNMDFSEDSVIDTITEEPPSPRKRAPQRNSRISKLLKKGPGQREVFQRENIIQRIDLEMEEIEMAYVEGRYNECINRAESCLNTVTSYTDSSIPNLMGVIAKLHSYIGNAAIENRDYESAIEHHERDLRIGEDGDDDEAVSRALGNLGRIYVFQNNHQKALELFSRKVPLCKTRLETAWLYHEIGNCFLVLGQYKFAMEAALRSLSAAEEAVEWSYQLQSLVLLGVAEVKLKNYSSAVNIFERARDQATMQGDLKAEEAITEALHDVNEKIVEELKSARGDLSRSERGYSRSRGDFSDKIYNPRSRAGWSDYSSIFIPEDDGDVSLTETGYDTDYLHLELDQLRSDFETSMFGSQSQLKTDRMSTRVTDRRTTTRAGDVRTLRSARPSARHSNMSSAMMRHNTVVG